MTTQQTNANARCRLHEQLGEGDESGVMKALCTNTCLSDGTYDVCSKRRLD